MDLDDVAEELYASPLERFVALRTEREKQVRAAGDRELAARIHALAKPNTVAWLANQLARRRAAEIGPLLELGAELRQATATLSGDELRALTRQRHQVVYALVQQARALAAEAGHRVSDDAARGLEQTLIAALADPEAGRQLAAGRLTEGLQPAGFFGDDAAAVPAPTPPARAPTSVDERRRQRAEQALADARHALRQARQDRDRADRDVERAQETAAQRQSDLARLRTELQNAEQAARTADGSVRTAQEALARAEQQLRRAEERERDASARLAAQS